MRKLLSLVVLCSGAAAQAQGGPVEPWPVQAEGGRCSISQGFVHPDFGRNALQVSYEPAAQRVTLTATPDSRDPVPEGEPVRLGLVFLENADEAYDPGWGLRSFSRGAGHLATAFEGRQNVEQILADLSSSKALGLLRRDGEILTGFELQGLTQGIARLRACASRLAIN